MYGVHNKYDVERAASHIWRAEVEGGRRRSKPFENHWCKKMKKFHIKVGGRSRIFRQCVCGVRYENPTSVTFRTFFSLDNFQEAFWFYLIIYLIYLIHLPNSRCAEFRFRRSRIWNAQCHNNDGGRLADFVRYLMIN